MTQTISKKEKFIQSWTKRTGYRFYPIRSEKSRNLIFKLATGKDITNYVTQGIEYLYLGYYYHSIKEVSKMIDCFQEAYSRGVTDALFELGKYYYQKRQFDLAVVKLKEGAAMRNTNSMKLLHKIYHFYLPDRTLSFNYLKEAADLKDPQAVLMLAELYVTLGNICLAKQHLQESLDLGETDAYISMAELAHIEGDDHRARELYDICVQTGNVNVYYYYAKFYQRLGDRWKAAELLERGLEKLDTRSILELIKKSIALSKPKIGLKYFETLQEYEMSGEIAYQAAQLHRLDGNTIDYTKMLFIGIAFDSIECHIEIALYYQSVGNDIYMLKHLQFAIDLKSSKAMIYLANYYKMKKNMNQYKKYIRMAIALNDPEAMIQYGLICEEEDDRVLTRKLIAESIREGQAEAYRMYGVFAYAEGSEEEAKDLWREGADQGDVACMEHLGAHYQASPTDQNFSVAKHYFRQAICYYSVDAYAKLGRLYITFGKEDRGYKYLLKAKDLGSDLALDYLGDWYKSQDQTDRMIFSYQMAASAGIPDSVLSLCRYYAESGDLDKLRSASKKIESSTSCVVHYEMSQIYDQLGLVGESIRYLQLASEYGESRASYKLGQIYRESDPVLSLKYFNEGIRNGDQKSAVELGGYYSELKDQEKTEFYYTKAMDFGFKDAATYLGFFYQLLGNAAKTIIYYNLGIKYGNPYAYQNLISFYLLDDEYEKAYELYCEAAKAGVQISCYGMALISEYLGDWQEMWNFYYLSIEQKDSGSVYSAQAIAQLFDEMGFDFQAGIYRTIAKELKRDVRVITV